ncbi:DUF932 domain-containing protein [Halobellus rubicundus]|uniref:DUF932 domain-containing protein n=1 Tax=Halobellus rubicundus TaxID=2996466 RepID=A0ABD5M819_9EURY
MERQDVYAHHEEMGEWERVRYRDSLWTDDGRATGVVSSNEEFYNVIQYGDILETVGDAVDRHSDQNLDVRGSVSLSPTAHKMSAKLDFDGATVYASQDDPIDLGLKVRSGHSGFHALKYDVGAERQVCSNGMMAFVTDLHFEQSHSEQFQPGLTYNAVDAVLESPAEIEHRLSQAQNRELLNQDEALLVLLENGVGEYLEQPVPDLLNALQAEVADPDNPTLWETYNAATRALTHYSDDSIPDYELDHGFESASKLLENGYSEIPDPEYLGRETVERRVQQRIDSQEDTQYWQGEDESLRELMQQHEIQA